MNMDYMSQFMGPGLGGIMAGTEQRQKEDASFAQTQKTLQDTVASQGQESERAALLPGKLAQERDRAEMAPLEREGKKLANEKLTEEQKRTMLSDYVNDNLQFGSLPGADETLNQKYPKLANHPIRQAMAEARAKDAARLPGQEGPTEVEKLQQRISQMDPKSRDAQAQREHQATLAKAAQDASQTRVETQEAARTQRLIMANQAKQELAETAAAAKAAGVNLSQDKYLVNLQQRLSEAELKGDVEEMGRIKSQLQQAKSIMMEINTATTTEKGMNAVLRARALGITLPDYAPVAPAQKAPPAMTTPQNVGPASRTSPGGRGATVGPAPVKTSEAPAAGPGPIAQALDAGAAAVFPSAQAAPPPQQGGGGFDWGTGQNIQPEGMMPPPAPQQGGMMQPVNAGPAPQVRAPANINFAATDIGPSGRAGVLQQEWKDLQSDISKAQQRLNVARRGGDREYIEQLEQNLRALERNLPMLAREIQSMSRGK